MITREHQRENDRISKIHKREKLSLFLMNPANLVNPLNPVMNLFRLRPSARKENPA